MVILDSTILIDLLNEDLHAVEKIKKLEEQGTEFFTTQINVFEVIQGIYGYGTKIDEELSALNLLLDRIKLLDLTYFSAYQSGKLAGELKRKGLHISAGDLLIAGIAKANKLNTIVTRNEKDFIKIPGILVETY